MKYVLRDVCDLLDIDTHVISVYLYNEELGIGIELRLKDHSCSNFRRTYEHFFKWLQDMINVEIEPDCIITAFEKFKNAHKDYMSYKELAKKLYCTYHEGVEEE